MSAPATTDAGAAAAPAVAAAPAAAAPAAAAVAVAAAGAPAAAPAPAPAAVAEDVKAAIASNRKSLERQFKGVAAAAAGGGGGPRASADRGIAPGLHAMAKRLERNLLSNSLNQQLYGRDDHASLTRAGVMKAPDVAPRLREKAARLQHARTRDQLGHLLEARSEQAHRRARSEHGAVASRLQGVKRQLQHHMTTNKVGHLLEQRSELETLQRLGVSAGDARVAPLLIGPQRMLQRSLVKSHLFHLLNKRPKPAVAAQQRWFQAPEEGADAADADGEGDEGEGDDDVNGADDDGGSGANGGGHLFDHHADADPNGAGIAAHGHGHGHGHGAADRKDQKHGGAGAHGHGHAHGAAAGAHAAAYGGGAEQKAADGGYQRRSKSFHLTRILLKTIAAMGESGELTLPQKGLLKDRVVDQDHVILQVAETYDAENDLAEFKESLIQLADISAKRS